MPVRIATAADRDLLQRLINEAFVVERFIKKGGSDRLDAAGRDMDRFLALGTFLLLEENDAPAGCVYLEPRGEACYLGLLSVATDRQGTGVGRSLCQAAETWAKEKGCVRMTLRVVSPRREQLISFYKKLGYEDRGVQDYAPELVAEMQVPGHFILMEKQI